MKKAFLSDLRSRLLGSVSESAEVLEYFSTDGSIFTLTPTAVVYPQNTADVRRAVGFAAERTTAGKPLSVTARGKGTDQSGGAIGDGLALVFPAHMNKVLRLDKDTVTVQPGISYASLQQLLQSHGRFLPPYPASLDFSTVGGAVGNNAAGEKTYKYGATRDYVTNLKVVLADGSLIETNRISARELHRRKGQSDLEGEIYRQIDSLILDNQALINKTQPATSKNATGYALGHVKHKNGSFDLSQLFIGSQGTLGIVTEITLKTLPWNPRTSLVVGFFDDVDKAGEAVLKLRATRPSAMEIVDGNLLEFLRADRPGDVEGLLPEAMPRIALLVEYDDNSQLQQALKTRRAARAMTKLATSLRLATEPLEQAKLWKIRRSAAAVIWMTPGAKKALPIIEDAVVPVAKLSQFLTLTYRLLEKHDLQAAIWGHAGDGNLHLQPFLDLAKPKDVEKLWAVTQEFYEMVISLGGSTSGEHNDGLLRAPYLKKMYGAEMYDLFVKTKTVCDPQNILNPGKKVNPPADLQALLRSKYSQEHLYDHMPHN